MKGSQTPAGFKRVVNKNNMQKDVGFYQTGVFAKDPAAEGMNQYGKPGTLAKRLQSEPWETSRPTSRYRSQRP